MLALQLIDVGQLLAFGVDLPEIGVSLHDDAGRPADIGLLDDPRIEGRPLRIAPAGRDFDVAAFLLEEVLPVGRVVGLNGLVDLADCTSDGTGEQ